MPRTIEQEGVIYVGVTSAMQLVKTVLGEEPDSYGPAALSKVHCLEGEGCHRVCLDWLAFEHKWLPTFEPPAYPPEHGSETRWQNVLHLALTAFQEFCREHEVVPIGIEQEVHSSAYRLAGHPDLICMMTINGRRVKAVVDLKFVAKILETHRLQARIYCRMKGCQDANIGALFHCDRNSGIWKLERVEWNTNLDDVMAVSHAAQLWAYGQQKRCS